MFAPVVRFLEAAGTVLANIDNAPLQVRARMAVWYSRMRARYDLWIWRIRHATLQLAALVSTHVFENSTALTWRIIMHYVTQVRGLDVCMGGVG